ncbi:MAG: hypothetical protein IPN90_12720 [Elusimicrobia bacterium]|nr:hypothetical protein [Elusimicrobiota bacterium]
MGISNGWNRGVLAAVACALTYLFISPVHAGGISTHFAELRVSEIQPGRTYIGSRDVTGEPYTVKNNTDESLDFLMMVRVPEPSELQPGYEPIPDTSWIRFQRAYFTAPAGQAGTNDYYIAVPTGTAFLGKKYQVQMGVQTFGGPAFVQMGLMGRAFLSVSDTVVPLAKGDLRAFGFSAQLTCTPGAVLAALPTTTKSRPFDTLFDVPIVVKNEGEYPVRCRVEVSDAKESFVYPPPGFLPAPKKIKVKIRPRVLNIPSHSEKTIQGTLTVPKDVLTSPGNYYVVLRIVTEDTPGEVETYTRIFLKGAP